MKIINGFLTFLFILFAAVQFNDPDPVHWIALYAFLAVVSGFAIKKKYNPKILFAGMLLCLIWMATLFPDFIAWLKMGAPSIVGSMKAETPYIELVREFLGVAICFGALVFHYFQFKKGIP